jgi:hypothetical protein
MWYNPFTYTCLTSNITYHLTLFIIKYTQNILKREIKCIYFNMGCTSCKEKKDIKEEMIKSGEFISKGIIWFAIGWSLLGIYGLITLISKIL